MLETSAKNLMLNALRTELTHVGLLNDSGTEITGGGYSRQSITFAAASGGEIVASNQPVFDVPGGATVGRIAFYSAATGGTKYSDSNVTNETYGGDGTYTVTSAKIDLNQA